MVISAGTRFMIFMKAFGLGYSLFFMYFIFKLPFRNCVPIENRTINMHLYCIIIRFGGFNIL